MTVKTTLSFTDRHHDFLKSKVEQGVFATPSAAVATAIEQLIEDEIHRKNALEAISSVIAKRMETPKSEFVSGEEIFSGALQHLGSDRAE
jgi:Arc/MetJ-type ribon-helix-helix transcriptional regulator